MEKSRGVYRVLVEKPEGKNHLDDPTVDGRTILRWIFCKWDVEAWAGSSIEPSGYIKCRKYLE